MSMPSDRDQILATRMLLHVAVNTLQDALSHGMSVMTPEEKTGVQAKIDELRELGDTLDKRRG